MRSDVGLIVIAMGMGTLLRLAGDLPGAVLQSSGRINQDNWCLAIGEAVWVLITISCIASGNGAALGAAYAFAISGALSLIIRLRLAVGILGSAVPEPRLINASTLRELLTFGGLVTIAQLADFLYAPTDFILISRLISTEAIAVYAPAVQVDAGLLVLVAAISGVLLPRAAGAHAEGAIDRLRQYYVHGTLLSVAMLSVAGFAVWFVSPLLFRVWLGEGLPQTRAILPLILIHTVVGGSSAVGRSILLGMGKVKPFTISVLIAGVANVVLSYVFVKYLNLGLRGIIYGTIIAVVARAGIWMPWYVMRTLRVGR